LAYVAGADSVSENTCTTSAALAVDIVIYSVLESPRSRQQISRRTCQLFPLAQEKKRSENGTQTCYLSGSYYETCRNHLTLCREVGSELTIDTARLTCCRCDKFVAMCANRFEERVDHVDSKL
jgi:hypothetical protein